MSQESKDAGGSAPWFLLATIILALLIAGGVHLWATTVHYGVAQCWAEHPRNQFCQVMSYDEE